MPEILTKGSADVMVVGMLDVNSKCCGRKRESWKDCGGSSQNDEAHKGSREQLKDVMRTGLFDSQSMDQNALGLTMLMIRMV